MPAVCPKADAWHAEWLGPVSQQKSKNKSKIRVSRALGLFPPQLYQREGQRECFRTLPHGGMESVEDVSPGHIAEEIIVLLCKL